MEEVENILVILEEAKKAIAKEDVLEIKNLSNKTIHTASIYQDPDNISLAVVLYALSKILERTNYKDYKDWPKFEKNYEESLNRAIVALKRKDIEVYREQIESIREYEKKISGNFKEHLEEVFRKAQISKASRIYEHGISLEKTAKILGVTLWELNNYVGKTGIGDVNLAYTMDIKDRLKQAEEIFK
jgi:hypothetical protein